MICCGSIFDRSTIALPRPYSEPSKGSASVSPMNLSASASTSPTEAGSE